MQLATTLPRSSSRLLLFSSLDAPSVAVLSRVRSLFGDPQSFTHARKGAAFEGERMCHTRRACAHHTRQLNTHPLAGRLHFRRAQKGHQRAVGGCRGLEHNGGYPIDYSVNAKRKHACLRATQTRYISHSPPPPQVRDKAQALFGSGWVWIIVQDGQLAAVSTPNQDNPLMAVVSAPWTIAWIWGQVNFISFISLLKIRAELVPCGKSVNAPCISWGRITHSPKVFGSDRQEQSSTASLRFCIIVFLFMRVSRCPLQAEASQFWASTYGSTYVFWSGLHGTLMVASMSSSNLHSLVQCFLSCTCSLIIEQDGRLFYIRKISALRPMVLVCLSLCRRITSHTAPAKVILLTTSFPSSTGSRCVKKFWASHYRWDIYLGRSVLPE